MLPKWENAAFLDLLLTQLISLHQPQMIHIHRKGDFGCIEVYHLQGGMEHYPASSLSPPPLIISGGKQWQWNGIDGDALEISHNIYSKEHRDREDSYCVMWK